MLWFLRSGAFLSAEPFCYLHMYGVRSTGKRLLEVALISSDVTPVKLVACTPGT